MDLSRFFWQNRGIFVSRANRIMGKSDVTSKQTWRPLEERCDNVLLRSVRRNVALERIQCCKIYSSNVSVNIWENLNVQWTASWEWLPSECVICYEGHNYTYPARQQKAFLVKFECTFAVRFGIALLIFHVFKFCCECWLVSTGKCKEKMKTSIAVFPARNST